MARCGYCGSMILFGGMRVGEQVFCNDKCRGASLILITGKKIPAEVIDRQIEEVWRGTCPKCRGQGPTDVHKFHEVWSILVLTRWVSNQQISCRSCAIKRQVGALAFSLFFGWWGFPWGLILTPVQITRNIAGMCGGPDAARPSDSLRRCVQLNLAAQLLDSGGYKAAKPPPLPGS